MRPERMQELEGQFLRPLYAWNFPFVHSLRENLREETND